MNIYVPVIGRRAKSCLSMYTLRLVAIIPFLLFVVNSLNAQVSGRVYKDFNANGTWDSTATYLDQGSVGVKVEAFDQNQVLKGSAVTNFLGKYTIPNVSGNLRIEFTVPQFYTDGFITQTGKGSQSSIQFVSAPVLGVDLGVNLAEEYCGTDPSVVVPCYVVGIGDNLTPNDGLATFKYSLSGIDHSKIGMPNTPISMVGSTWGGAYQRESGSFFTAAFMKRHAGFGIGGTGAIYVTKNVGNDAASSTELYLKLSDFGINTGSDPHSAPNYQMDTINANGNPFDAVGKTSLGDLDISSDGKYLFVVNLKERTLHRIFIDSPHKPAGSITAADITSWAIPSGFDEVNKGIGRPFGLCVRQDKVYVGVTCDASISNDSTDLKARIYEFQPDAATPVWKLDIEFPLNYHKGMATGERPESKKWYPWISDWYLPGQPDFMRGLPNPTVDKYVSYPMPLLSDIELDVDGSMVVAFLDRFSHQVRFSGVDAHGSHHGTFGFDPRTGGDILRIGHCDGINWTLENNGTVCGTTTAGKDNNQGAGGGEFYFGDTNDPLGHYETSTGALAFRPGYRDMILASSDPIRSYSAGVIWLGNETGIKERSFEVLEELSHIINNAPVNYGKASSLGDVNIMCDISPLEIGNFVWRDLNGNGIQDAGEPGIPGVILHLVNSDNQIVGRDTTDINGVYAFNHFNVVDTLGVSRPNRLGPQPNTTYSIKVKGQVTITPAPAPAPTPLAKKSGNVATPSNLYSSAVLANTNSIAVSATTTNDGGRVIDDNILGVFNGGTGPNGDLIDSDGFLIGTDGIIVITTGSSGQSNHSFDFAYCPLPKYTGIGQKALCDSLTGQIKTNAKIILSNIQYGQKIGYSIGSTYTGPSHANATNLNNVSSYTIDNLPVSATAVTYIVRIFNGSDTCSRDMKVTINGTVCTSPCKITTSVQANSINVSNNGTSYNPSDDYFSVLIQTSVISAGASGLYEVVINANVDGTGGTVLNVGGTTYGSAVRVGLAKELKANGQPIKLTVRDKNKSACFENLTVQANPFPIECKVICLPMKTKIN